MKKNGFLAMVGLITLVAAALAGAYYFLNKKRECVLHCGDGTCGNDDAMEEDDRLEEDDGSCATCNSECCGCDLPEEPESCACCEETPDVDPEEQA